MPWPSRPRLVLVDRPGAPQSIVRMVAPGIDRFSPDRPGLSMLNAILGGSFTSRLNFNLREKHGFTYGAASSFSFLRHAGTFAARAAVFAESTAPAVREMLSELRGLRERPITTEEHAKAHATLLMRVAEGLSSTGGMATTFGELGLYGLPLDEPMRFVAALQRTTADDLRALGERYVDPEAACIVIVGDRAAIEPGLRELGLPRARIVQRRRRRPQPLRSLGSLRGLRGGQSRAGGSSASGGRAAGACRRSNAESSACRRSRRSCSC